MRVTALPHVTFDSHTLAHCDAGRGGRPPHQVTSDTAPEPGLVLAGQDLDQTERLFDAHFFR